MNTTKNRPQTTQLGARIPTGLYSRLSETAGKTGRTLGGLVALCCEAWLPYVEAEITVMRSLEGSAAPDATITMAELKRISGRKGGRK
jgi:hypothetical protein